MITEHHIMTYNEGNKMSESWKESIGLWSFMESTRHSTLLKRILLRLVVWTFTESTSAAQRTLLGRRWLSLRSLESLLQLISSHPRWANSSCSCSTSIQCLLLSYKTDFHVLPHNHFHFLSHTSATHSLPLTSKTLSLFTQQTLSLFTA